MNIPSFARSIAKPLSKVMGSINGYWKLDGMLSPIYPRSIHEDHEGEWFFDKELKPIEGFPVYFKWNWAIMEAQDELKGNSNIQVPILLMHSHDSYLPTKHESRVMKSDIVLNVEHMKNIGPGLGKNVTMVEIKNGLHDLFLSPSPVREEALEKTAEWLGETI
jgi:alpha-beta hydrolase superfamily lysophospholipase